MILRLYDTTNRRGFASNRKKIIKNFDVHKFKKSIDEHHKVLGSFENGYARKAIMNLIDLKIKGD